MSENNTLITVVMPVRDNEKLMPKAVKSILDQNFQDWELIIMEGRSSDNTAKLADEYAASDERIRAFHIDEWMYESTNIGFSMAKGQYVTVLNSDDLLMPGALLLAAEHIYAYEPDVYLFAVANAECDADQNVLSTDAEATIARMPKGFVLKDKDEVKRNWINLLYTGLLNNQLNVYKKDLIADERLRNDIYAADYYFNLCLLPKISSIAYAPVVSYQFNSYKTEGQLNASLGKYYGYQHDMFNDFYHKGIEVFSTNEMLTKSALKFVGNRRMVDFLHELESYNYAHCKLTLEERLFEIFKYAWDVKEIFSSQGSLEVLERSVLETAIAVIGSMPGQDAGKMKNVCDGCAQIALILNGQGDQADSGAIEKMAADYYNPGHIGISFTSQSR